ncbi:type II toxin-antitoxin system HicA family toxin [bacterium]|nr:type II toxin-antitoxin system HicA family toxin [bacterium]MBU1615766.1 type II toxin-antitoxin system HicA family toxin [bacterium]
MPTNISLKELIAKFRRLGYSGPFSGGRHQFMIKGRQKIRIPNPHGSKEIDVSLVKEIIRQARISNKEWDEA